MIDYWKRKAKKQNVTLNLMAEGLDFLKSHLSGMVVKTDLELIEYTFATKEIKANTKT